MQIPERKYGFQFLENKNFKIQGVASLKTSLFIIY